MKSRMERYNELDIEDYQRTKKNATLYEEVYGDYDNFENLPLEDNMNEINIENLKSLMGTRTSRLKERIEQEEIEIQDEEKEEVKEKVHDINALIEKARQENAKIKIEEPINKNIPNYLANLESDKNTKEIILKYNGTEDEDMPIVKKENYLTVTNTNNINTSSLSLSILSDLKPSGDTQVSEPMSKGIALKNEEEDFYSKSLEFTKEDFEEEEEEEEEEDFYDNEKGHPILKAFLIIFSIALVVTITYFIVRQYTSIF